jgi:hypothetical protein
MAAVSLQTLIRRAKRRANQENSDLCGDDEITDYINEGAKRLHELVAGAYGNEYVKKTSAGTWPASAADIALPSDFFKLTGVDFTVNGKSVSLERYEEAERNRWKNLSTTNWYNIPRYKLENNRLMVLPVPSASFAYELRYIPLLQVTQVPAAGIINEFSSASQADTIDFPNGWEKFVVLYTAIELMDKEETETAKAVQKLAKWEAELIDIAANRDAGQPQQAIDVERGDIDPRWW